MKKKLFGSLNVTLLMFYYKIFQSVLHPSDRRGRDRMVVGFTTTCAISAYHH